MHADPTCSFGALSLKCHKKLHFLKRPFFSRPSCLKGAQLIVLNISWGKQTEPKAERWLAGRSGSTSKHITYGGSNGGTNVWNRSFFVVFTSSSTLLGVPRALRFIPRPAAALAMLTSRPRDTQPEQSEMKFRWARMGQQKLVRFSCCRHRSIWLPSNVNTHNRSRTAWLMFDVMGTMSSARRRWCSWRPSISLMSLSKVELKNFGDMVSPYRTPLFTLTTTLL